VLAAGLALSGGLGESQSGCSVGGGGAPEGGLVVLALLILAAARRRAANADR
jgi:MYXO-CTERM domain-containing protein